MLILKYYKVKFSIVLMSLATKLALDAVILNIISSVCLVREVERERSVRQ
jgi:hypothetical protein